VVDADGSGLRRLTHDTTDDGQASWSPDGRRIAFLSWRDGPNPDVFVMNADGSDQHNLTHTYGSEHDPVWSPDGKKIAFTGAGMARLSDVYVMDADGGNLRRLTRTISARQQHGGNGHLRHERRRQREAEPHADPQNLGRRRHLGARAKELADGPSRSRPGPGRTVR
jgi:tricorn protease-like protein